MSCQDFAAALVDEQLPRPPGFQAHLEHCEDCRALARFHSSARRLRLAEPPLPPAFAPEAIHGEVRRRQYRRRWVAGAGSTCAVALLAFALSVRDEAPEHVPPPGAPLEGVLGVEPIASTGEGPPGAQGDFELESLVREVDGYTRTRPAVEDRTYAAFGLLATWVRPPDSTALDAEPFRTALRVIHPSRSQ
ncbi:hypothetical protein D187_010036 [Cystobacter fuscus DSM 2262]|uniref:Zinc-finger domain-containing protein n=1 Tax=Cystobacter fuscus (strain ATCC 25194 / DSM 2262 / NBRC 100088 / M29) TaxID=1242864 RepID=S9PIC2_CYSF2|nr:hypothetical protein [Cystobacter fuscus]EPX62132.1 hypothetical protein D187_010036 [Cystobacter fuscus DSM 2262]